MQRKPSRWRLPEIFCLWICLAPALLPARAAAFAWEFTEEGQPQKAVVRQAADGRLRIDRPNDRWSLLYDPKKREFTGLEHRDGTWWRFRWAEVLAKIKELRLLNTKLGLTVKSPVSLIAEREPGAPAPSPNFGWNSEEAPRRAFGQACLKWKGTAPNGDPIEVLAQRAALPGLASVIALLPEVEEPMRLVAARPLWPALLAPATRSLLKEEGATAREIRLPYEPQEKPTRLVDADAASAPASLFQIPDNFREVPLAALEQLLGAP